MNSTRKLTLVDGYIRAVITSSIIPYEIIHLLCNFINFPDQWDQTYVLNDRYMLIKIIPDTNSILKMIAAVSADHGTAYGQLVVDHTSGIQSWKLKIMKYRLKSCIWFAQIGIVENDDAWLKQNLNSHKWYKEQRGYGFLCGNAKCVWSDGNNKTKRKHYGQKCNKEEYTVEMILNVKEGTLRYIINDTDYGFAFDNIDKTKEYKLAVSLSRLSVGSKIQLY